MYIAMNRFQVSDELHSKFEEVWKGRDSFLHEQTGFKEFHLLRGDAENGAREYISHSTWESKNAFLAWTESEAFRKAHSSGPSLKGVVLGPPKFTGYEVIL